MNLLSKKFFSKIFIILSLFLAIIPLPIDQLRAAAVCGDTTCDYKAGEDIFNCKPDCLRGVPTKSVKDAIYDTTDWILGFASAISVFMLIIGGLYYVMSTGNQEQVTTAKKIIQYSIYGLVVVGISYALIVVVSTIVV